MKRYGSIILISFIIFSCLSIVSFSENYPTSDTKELKKEEEVIGDVVEEKENDNLKSDIFATSRDAEGNLYGPKEFIRTNNGFYLLNTFSKKVSIINDGKVISNIFLEDINPDKMAIDGNIPYVLDLSQFLIAKVVDKSKIEKYPIIGLDDESVSNFSVSGNKAYISIYKDDKDVTLIFNFSNDEFVYESEIEGIVNGDEVYSFVSDDDTLNSSGVLTIKNIVSGAVDKISVATNNTLLGVKYLGRDKDGNILICSNELLREDNDENVNYIKSLNLKDSNLKEYVVDDNTLCSFYDGDIFQFNPSIKNVDFRPLKISDNSPQILPDEEINNEHSNDFDQSALKLEERLAVSPISRNTIIENAKKYHTSFSWSCKANNLSYLKNYTKPRYVSKAGKYKSMPYCWGGFNTTAQFVNGLSKGGRVGNIYTGTYSHVPNTFGLDCSGFVSRCWNLSSHYGTGQLPEVSNNIAMDKLQKGDALLMNTHVILFDSKNSNGDFVLYEATTYNSYDRVSHTIRTVSYLKANGYKAIRFKNVR